MYYKTEYDSPLGRILLTASETALCGLSFDTQPPCGESESAVFGGNSVLLDVRKWLDAYFTGKRVSPKSLPLEPRGSAFARRVWQIIAEIPYGETLTYGDIAKRIAAERGVAKMSAQAVGGAVGGNPIPVIIPCHRVVGAGGNLTGYTGGLDIKTGLLKLEGFDMSRFKFPKSRQK